MIKVLEVCIHETLKNREKIYKEQEFPAMPQVGDSINLWDGVRSVDILAKVVEIRWVNTSDKKWALRITCNVSQLEGPGKSSYWNMMEMKGRDS